MPTTVAQKMERPEPTRPWRRRLALLVVLLVASVLLMRGLGNPSLNYADADRILMDGVFLHDFLRELPLNRIYEFTISYYAQYPALSIGYRPPFFPFVEAIFNGVFGINTWSSRLALLAFALLGVTAWFKLVETTVDTTTAFWASLLLVTTPFVVQWGWYTMGEVPVLSMAMLTAYLFHRFIQTERSRYLYATAIAFSLAVWTKQTAVFLAVWFVVYVIIKGRLFRYIRRKDVWITILLILVMIGPLAAVTLWIGESNIAQSVGYGEEASPTWRLRWDNWEVYLRTLARDHLTPPVLILSLLGLGWALAKRDSRGLYFGLLILTTYLFFSYLTAKDTRYPIFWIPAFSLFAALPLFYLRQSRPLRIAALIALSAITVYQVNRVYAMVPAHATGYDTAARHVLSDKNAPVVFFDGVNNGYFTYFMRALDPDRSRLVLRGNKLLSSSAIYFKLHLQVHAHSREDIQKIFDQYGVVYVVVESRDQTDIPIHRTLREFLESGPFGLEREIPVSSNLPHLAGQTLRVYRYLEPKRMTATTLELRLPIVGRTLRVPMPPPTQNHGAKAP